MNTSHTPRIAIEFQLVGTMGRRRLQGVFEFLRQKQVKWDIRLPQNEDELLRELENDPDGVIVSRIASPSTLRRLETYPKPVVFVDIPMAERRHMRKHDVTIHNDNGGIGLKAADYFLRIGQFNSFCVYSSQTSRHFSKRRSDAFVSALAKHGRKTQVYEPTEGSLADWLTALPKPSAVFATWDECARDVILASHQAHIHVPDQLVVLGADDDEIICTLMTPELSSIRLDSEKEGYRAAEELHKILCGRAKPGQRFVLVKALGITERASTKPPPPATEFVRRALEYISAHATHGITPNDVARHLHCSRRLLDLRFATHHKTTVQRTITQMRLETVRRELRQSQNSISDIAVRCGFSSDTVLRNLFHRTYGISMREFKAGLG